MIIPRDFNTKSTRIRYHEYIDRLFKIESSYATWMCVCKIVFELNENQLICKCKACKVVGCAFVLAHKYWEDDPYIMQIYSDMTGISLKELLKLEKIMVIDILFKHFSHKNIYRFKLADEHAELNKLKQMQFHSCECC